MSTTTQILFNSPALHSLKREQLVKLCKIHSLKANGKNIELIQKLRRHAQSLPKDAPLSVAARSECDGQIPCQPMETDDCDQQMIQEDDVVYGPRPSEQWEVVMDSIEEVEENSSQSTLSSQRTVNNAGSGEFGTGGSTTSTVTSSIRALATSLGLRKTMAKLPSDSTSSKTTTGSQAPGDDDLSKNSKRYSTIPTSEDPPQTDHVMLETGCPSGDESPLPGHALRPGIPAPPNARLSLGLGLGVPVTPTRKSQPITTIRLVSNPVSQQESMMDFSYADGVNGTPQLKPFQTTFDITFGSPVTGDAFNSGFSGFTSWPPKATKDAEMATQSAAPDVINSLPNTQMVGTDKEDAVPSSPRLNLPMSSPPFIFGSPRHSVSNNQFRDAAASVLEEMNARLRAEGVDEIGADIINKLHPSRSPAAHTQRGVRNIPTSKRGEITSRFDEVHQQEFSKMEGIDALKRRHPQAKELEVKEQAQHKSIVGRKRKSDVLEQDSPPKRPSSLANRPRVSATRVISAGRRSKVVPGGFGLEDEDEEGPFDSRAGKRVRTDSETLTTTEEPKRKDNDERDVQLEKDKEVIRKRLGANKAKRRSSAAGRKSLGRNGPRPSVLIKPKPKPSRFGFLSSAKSLVQSVWNRGKASTAAPPSNIPKPMTASAQTGPHASLPKEDKGRTRMAPPSFIPNRKAALVPAKSTTVTTNGNKTAVLSTRSSNATFEGSQATRAHASLLSTRSSRSRSPLPSFSPLASHSNSFASGRSRQTNDKNVRANSILGTAKSRNSAGVSVSSVGIRFSGLNTPTATGSDYNNIGSMGTKNAVGGTSMKSSVGTAGSSTTTRTMAMPSSRLLAPTASSLAKTVHQSTGDVGSLKIGERRSEKTALGSITNSQVINQAEYPPSKLLLLSTQSGEAGEDLSSNGALPKNSTTAPLKRTLSGRKPRISRSKVIAKLASQRAASGSSVSSTRSSTSGTGSVLKPRVAGSSGRTRSSIGVKVARASYGTGVKSRSSNGGNGLVAAIGAKRAARQSEYSRRRSSRVVPTEGDF